MIPRFSMRGLLVFWLFVLSAVAYFDRTNISIAGTYLRDELHIDNLRLGWIFSSFVLGYAIFQVPGGWLAYKFGPRRILAGGVLWWGVFTALTAVANPRIAHALLLLIFVRFSLGAGEAVMYPASNQFVAQWIPVAERGRANGWIFAGVGAGAAISVPTLSWLIRSFGWRSSFWFSALLGIAVGLIWFLIARDTPEAHSHVSPLELKLIQTTRKLPQVHPTSPVGSWRTAVLNRNVVFLTLSYFSFGYVAWNFFSWFYIYLAEARGLDLRDSVIFTMLPFAAMTLCCLLGGWACDRLVLRYGRRPGRCTTSVVSFALTAVFLVVGATASGSYTASIVLAGGAGALYLSQSSFWALSADIGGERSGIASGVMNMGGQIGAAVTASLTPYLASRFGWTTAFVFAAAIAVAGGVFWIFVDPGRSLPTDPSA